MGEGGRLGKKGVGPVIWIKYEEFGLCLLIP